MEQYPGARLSLSQLIYALEKHLDLLNQSFSDAILYKDEIDKLSSISTSVYQLKNLFAPINRLPPEVLALIPTFRKHERDLINATAVCKYWRRTLISTPSLWNKIICSEHADPQVIAPRVQTYLERSGSVPLEVQTQILAFRPLSSHTERISSLEIFLDHELYLPPYLHEIVHHISKPAPLLETITFHATSQGCSKLPLPLFETLLSSVKTLNVRGVSLAPASCKLSQLTKFTLETRLHRFTTIVLLDLLDEMPLLQLLEVKLDCSARQFHEPVRRVVTLSRLEEVAITTDERFRVPLSSPILPVLCLPSVRRVNMRSIGAYGAPHTPFLPPVFEEQLPSLSTTPEVFFTVAKGFNIEFFGLDRSQLTLHINSSVAFSFSKTIFGGTPFSSVLKLHICFQTRSMDLLFLFGMLRAMERLECLEMKYNTVRPLAYWAMGQERTLICPALMTLLITDVNFDKAEYYVQMVQRARESAGLPIAHVEVRRR